MITSPTMKWFGLALLSAVQFMVVLDIAIVNVALPSIQTDLGFSQENLQWVISAYALVFGGFLLLGGRMADLLGRRRDLHARPRRLHGRLAALRAGLVRGVADRRSRDSGSRRRDDLAGRARDPDDDLRRGPRAQHRARRLGRGGRLRRRRRRPARRRSSPTRSPGSGSSSSTSRSASPRSSLAPVLLTESRDTRVKSFDALGAVLVTAGLSHARPRDHAGPRLGLELRPDDRRLRRLGGAARRLRLLGEPRRPSR